MHELIIIITECAFFKKLKDQICNTQNRRYGEMAGILFETYKILSCHMARPCFKQPLTRQWQKMYISIIKLCFTTLEMCVALLCAMSMDLSSKYRIRSAKLKCYPHHNFSCLSTHFNLYCSCQTPFQ